MFIVNKFQAGFYDFPIYVSVLRSSKNKMFERHMFFIHTLLYKQPFCLIYSIHLANLFV